MDFGFEKLARPQNCPVFSLRLIVSYFIAFLGKLMYSGSQARTLERPIILITNIAEYQRCFYLSTGKPITPQ